MCNRYSASAGLVFLNTLAAVAISNRLQNVFHLSSMMTNSLMYCLLIFSLNFCNERWMIASRAVISAVGDMRFFASCSFICWVDGYCAWVWTWPFLRYGRVSL